MNVVGKVGSLISQGVYSVATPFHPFGGAVDVIVVEQQDGTYRSTPWYVRFGKFQGVLKGAEKIVTITVNGVEANFHMYLDNSGQAYFMREVMSGSTDADSSGQAMNESNTPQSHQGDNIDNSVDDHENIFDENKGEVENDDQLYRFQDQQASPDSSAGSSGFGNYHYGSLDEVEDMVKESNESNSEMVLVSVDGHVLMAPISSNEENTENVQLSTPQFHLGPGGEGSGEDFRTSGVVWEAGLFGDLDASTTKDTDVPCNQVEDSKDCREVSVHVEEAHHFGNRETEQEDAGVGLTKDDMFKSCLDLMAQAEGDMQIEGSSAVELDPKVVSEYSQEITSLSGIALAEMTASTDPNCRGDASQPVNVETEESQDDVSVDLNQKDEVVGADVFLQNSNQLFCEESWSKSMENESSDRKHVSGENISEEWGDFSVHSVSNDKEHMGTIAEGSVTEEESNETESPGLQRSFSGLGFDISLCGNLLRPGMGFNSAGEAFEAHRISEESFRASGPSIIKNGNLIVRFEGKYLPWDEAAHIILGKAVFGPNFSVEPKDSILVEHEDTLKSREETHEVSPSFSRRWRLWPIPFRRAKSLQHSNSNSSEELFVDSESGLQSPNTEQSTHVGTNQSPRKQFIRTNIPTNEQIASLNLKEGQNMIAFSFSTRVLGKQQVDAHIYLWKWNTRIVISDVDGTITKSDVLGQFMPLVGKDWTQSGVARLFSAIKENGYQLLFLSARAIVQAYLTRSFLLNLKQDGKALPNGPVVISPDGLFPSLYREVIRRAPHEFKIACLEEDFNSWNYWKMPLPDIEY
ncbi:phosphatidate phosphatase PAH1 isoform X2 [Phoenix dactylifera]|uniref:phosphatidate phosphatase n=1 Tax=Phoenix dactylifera TaxID=42345 RepID=A0A8B9A2U1_PHODC|nr:phosphatidate phosphatase PAH1 isoform X2 [Phoenix dactylifera]XP_038980941.1 phosphatidate phosphatase PAH1 isoform X2 [Phoenix dactylifera]